MPSGNKSCLYKIPIINLGNMVPVIKKSFIWRAQTRKSGKSICYLVATAKEGLTSCLTFLLPWACQQCQALSIQDLSPAVPSAPAPNPLLPGFSPSLVVASSQRPPLNNLIPSSLHIFSLLLHIVFLHSFYHSLELFMRWFFFFSVSSFIL